MALYANGIQQTMMPASYPASRTSFNNTGTGMTSTNVQDAISELNADISKGYIEVIGDGVKTYSQILNELYALIDSNKVTPNMYLANINPNSHGQSMYHLRYISSTSYEFCMVEATANNMACFTLVLKSSGSTYKVSNSKTSGITFNDYSSTAFASGYSMRIYY